MNPKKNFLVYQSSAGAGKTFTLVLAYLKLILGSTSHFRNILAITFTNKAAWEMKNRVLETLTDIAKGKPCIFLEPLCDELKIDTAELKRKAQSSLTDIIHNYSDFSILTIDSFFYSILRGFTREVNASYNFEVEIESESVKNLLIQELFTEAKTNDLLYQFLLGFSLSKIDDERGWNIDLEIRELIGQIFDETKRPFLDRIRHLSLEDFKALSDNCRSQRNSVLKSIETIAAEALSEIRNAGIEFRQLGHNGNGGGGLGKYFESQWRDKPNKTVETSVEDDEWWTKHFKRFKNIDILRDSLRTKHALIERLKPKYFLLHGILRKISSVGLLPEIFRLFEVIKRRERFLHISDFNSKVFEILKNEPSGFIYERISARYKHILIDEFQDTSLLQWHNLLPLIDENLAYDQFNMIVGDPKQSIYRFRGGQFEQFVQLPKIFDPDHQVNGLAYEVALERNIERKILSENYRSQKHIVLFNNDFFKTVCSWDKFSFGNVYSHVEQTPTRSDNEGYVQISFVSKVGDKTSILNDYLSKTLAIVTECTRAGNYDWDDIAVLTRTNRQCSDVTDFLIKNGVSVVSEESLLLNNSREVQFLLSILRHRATPEDKSIRATSLYLYFEITQQSIDHLRILTNSRTQSDFIQYFEALVGRSFFQAFYTKPLYTSVEFLVEIFGLLRGPNPFVLQFLDAALSFESKHGPDTGNFLAWWDESKINLSLPARGVKVMTIHKSKGLQFPVVLCPFANWDLTDSQDDIWVELPEFKIPNSVISISTIRKIKEPRFEALSLAHEKNERLDNLNLLYVTMTRAKDRLYLLCEDPLDSNRKSPSDIKKINHIFFHYLSSNGSWSPDTQKYEFGNPDFSRTEAPLRTPDIRFGLCFSKEHLVGIQSDDQDDRRYGLLFHEALSQIRKAGQLQESVSQIAGKRELDELELENLRSDLNSFITHREIAPFFNDSSIVETEREILDSNGEIKRIDRIQFYPEKTTVIEFKTGSESPTHRNQILNYKSSLSTMGLPPVEAFLIYTHPIRVQRI